MINLKMIQGCFCYLICVPLFLQFFLYQTLNFFDLCRYVLKINVGDDLDEIEFIMYDDVVKKFAPITYTKFQKEVSLCFNFIVGN
jgi:hypothetical protein